ncbi:hypothetical protein PsorP6_009012 [Peronosclerospora sorghi]|uniref:Uncharacterized protein n=1 Tax=Peronosclerospora sorghi TaxID=230839 RepID=A0ACC0VZT1_9STRA|nr:hypothetical protein PsorP6_009012 [Peronosclerospora sorghi]
MLGPEWEESYAKLKQSTGHKDTKDEATRADTETRNRVEEVREPIGHEVNDVREAPLSPHFLLSAVSPPSASRNSATFAMESPVLTPVGEEQATGDFHFMKTFGTDDLLFHRSRNFSDYSEGLMSHIY